MAIPTPKSLLDAMLSGNPSEADMRHFEQIRQANRTFFKRWLFGEKAQ